MAKEDRQHADDPIDILLDVFDNTALPDFVIECFTIDEPDKFDITDLIVDMVENTDRKCTLLRNAVNDTKDVRLRKLFDTFPSDQRKEILDSEYRNALVGLSKLAGPDGTVLVQTNLTPQNWNGNRYQGTACINLQIKMATHPGWLPVFATSDQIRAIGVQRKSGATVNSVVCKFGDDSHRFRHIAWNIEDLDFNTRHPRHLIAFREKFAGSAELPVTKAAMDLVMQDGGNRSVEDVIRDLVRATDVPGQRPRFNSPNIPVQERRMLKNLVEDLAVMSICTRLRASSHVRLGEMMRFPAGHFSVAYPFQTAMALAGKITVDLDKKLQLFNKRGIDMDSVTNRVNKELEKELLNSNSKSMKK